MGPYVSAREVHEAINALKCQESWIGAINNEHLKCVALQTYGIIAEIVNPAAKKSMDPEKKSESWKVCNSPTLPAYQ